MKKRLTFAILFFALSGLSFLGLFYFLKIKGRLVSALQVTATPRSQIYLDGKLVGQTPYFSDKLKPGEYTVEVVPEGKASLSFKEKIPLRPLLLTALDRTFREEEDSSEGSILTLEPISNKKVSEVAITSLPSSASIFLDGELKGTTPLFLSDISPSDHELEFKFLGFLDKRVRIKTSSGFKLSAIVKLAVSKSKLEASPSATPTPTPSPIQVVPMVRVKQTPTGFLRVRISPSLSATEVARVKPGETFPLLEEISGWTKISLPDGTFGWVSSLYIVKP